MSIGWVIRMSIWVLLILIWVYVGPIKKNWIGSLPFLIIVIIFALIAQEVYNGSH